MIKTLIFIIILCLAIFAGPHLSYTQGFVHIATNTYVIETSLTMAIITIVVFFALLYAIVKLIKYFIVLPKGTFNWFSNRNKKRSHDLQEEAIIAYFEGDYERAVKLIEKSGPLSKLSVGQIFMAAKSSFELKNIDKVRKYIEYAAEHHKEAAVAVDVLRAQLNFELGNVNSSMEYISHVTGKANNPLVKRLNYDILKAKGDIDELYKASGKLVSTNVITEADSKKIYLAYIRNKLKQAHTVSDVHDLYKTVTKSSSDVAFVCPILDALIEKGDVDFVKKLTLKMLNDNPSKDLLESIANWNISIPEVLKYLEDKANENMIASQVNVPMLKALGNMEFQEGLLDNARVHFEKALELSKSRDLYLKLANTLARQQQYARANDYFMRANALE